MQTKTCPRTGGHYLRNSMLLLPLTALLGFAPLRAARADVLYSGADSRVVYQGRTQYDGNYPYSPDHQRIIFSWTGSELRIRFTGSTKVLANIRVTGQDTVPYLYVLDGNPILNSNGTPRQDYIKTLGGTTTILTGLSTGEHTLVIRNDGASQSSNWVESITLDDGASLLQAAALPTRKVEFYGDSVTANSYPIPLVANATPSNESQWGISNYYTYGGQVSRNLNADTRWVAQGGMGVAYSFIPFTLRDVWNKVASDPNSSVYDTSLWRPDVVVLAIGQNDQFNYPANQTYAQAYQGFVNAYLAQVRNLRSAYPSAYIFCMNTTMTDPGFFDKSDGSGVFNAIRNDSTLGNDPKILLKQFAYQGFGTHPAGPQHKQMADTLTQWIRDATGWQGDGNVGTIDTSHAYKIRIKYGNMLLTQGDNAGANNTPANYFNDYDVQWQKWRFEDAGSGYYRVRNTYTNKVLTQADNAGADGTLASLFDNYDLDWQRWAVENSNGYWRIRNKYSGKVLTKSNYDGGDNTGADLFNDYSLDWQRFSLDPLCLTGNYYDNIDFTGTKKTRLDATVNFNWGTSAPISGIAPTTYSIRWTGSIVPKYTQPYTFYVNADDGVRLWVNGVQIINSWINGSSERQSSTINLIANKKYPIKLEYYNNTGAAHCQLYWSSASQVKQVIPDSATLPY